MADHLSKPAAGKTACRARTLRSASSRRTGRRSADQIGPGGLREADTAQEILKPSVGSKRIEGRPQEDRRFEARFIGLVQRDHRLALIAETHINQGDIGIGRRVLIMPGPQVCDGPSSEHRAGGGAGGADRDAVVRRRPDRHHPGDQRHGTGRPDADRRRLLGPETTTRSATPGTARPTITPTRSPAVRHSLHQSRR
jgi:hypothetical protein